jgi:hypothetical protein
MFARNNGGRGGPPLDDGDGGAFSEHSCSDDGAAVSAEWRGVAPSPFRALLQEA